MPTTVYLPVSASRRTRSANKKASTLGIVTFRGRLGVVDGCRGWGKTQSGPYRSPDPCISIYRNSHKCQAVNTFGRQQFTTTITITSVRTDRPVPRSASWDSVSPCCAYRTRIGGRSEPVFLGRKYASQGVLVDIERDSQPCLGFQARAWIQLAGRLDSQPVASR